MEDVCQINQKRHQKPRKMSATTVVILWYICHLVCGCGVKRDLIPLQLCQAGLGFVNMLCMRSCPFHHGNSSFKV